jgi:methionine-rich copper-binding protein CopC
MGTPHSAASHEASLLSQFKGTGTSVSAIPHFFRLDFADATKTVFEVMAIVMAVAAVVAVVGLQKGLQQEPPGEADPAVGDNTEVRS